LSDCQKLNNEIYTERKPFKSFSVIKGEKQTKNQNVMVKNKLLWIILIGFCMFIYSGCGSNTQKSGVNNEAAKENVISEELHQAHCDLLAKANEELANINQKVRDLNDKIRSKGGKLTDAQNSSLDDFEAKQASINKRMHQIKNVKQEEWDNFKTTFEKDLEEIKMLIDNISKEF
jgi:dGTP triphosphohydrolase